ncbi:MAG: hypothetical protein ACREBR_00145 [bacterium]
MGNLVPQTTTPNNEVFAGKNVALECKDELEIRIRALFGGEIPVDVLKSGHVVENVISAAPGKQNLYNLAWEFTGLGISQVSQVYMFDGIQAAKDLAEVSFVLLARKLVYSKTSTTIQKIWD